MIYLGFHLGHDSNVAVAVNGKIKYRKSERFFGKKHHRALGTDFVFQTLKDWGIEHVDYCAYTNPDFECTNKCDKEALFCLGDMVDFKSFQVDHHYAHALSAWPIIDTEKVNYAVVEDGRGDWERHMMVIKNPAANPKVINVGYGWSMGWDFYQLGKLLGFEGMQYDFAGKLMGLQAYSEDEISKVFGLPILRNTDYKTKLQSSNHYTTLSEFHEYWWKYIRNIFDFNKNSIISYSGGCAQNTIYNYLLKKDFSKLYIPPHCYDGGLSLGCLEFLRLQLGDEKFDNHDFPYWQDDRVLSVANWRTISKTANLLANGKIVGWMQGSGEIGPRALGNRSILMATDKKENKDILNQKVKNREPWRPYAGSILQSSASEYFDMDESPYMLYACKVIKDSIPAITHVDNTCRMQTVQEGVFYNLIQEYFRITGIPVILNTSLNIARKPIVSKKDDALDLLNTTAMDALVVGNEIYTKWKLL